MSHEEKIKTIQNALLLISKGMADNAYNDIVIPRLAPVTVSQLWIMLEELQRGTP